MMVIIDTLGLELELHTFFLRNFTITIKVYFTYTSEEQDCILLGTIDRRLNKVRLKPRSSLDKLRCIIIRASLKPR